MAPRTYEENLVALFIPGAPAFDLAVGPSAATDFVSAIDLSSYIRKNGGIDWPDDRGTVPTDTIDRRQNTTYPGSEGGMLGLEMLIENRAGDTLAWTTFADGEVEGVFVFGFQGSATTAADEVDLMHIVADRPVRNQPDRDTNQQFSLNCHLQDSLYYSAVLA